MLKKVVILSIQKNMYEKSFFLEWPIWNNAFAFNQRINKRLYVPNLVEGTISGIELWNEIVFEDIDFDDNFLSCKWLKNFYNIAWKGKNIYLFDNHNHAYFFWHLESLKQKKNNYTLIHIDEHSDMRDPQIYLEKRDLSDIKKIFEYTNYKYNVGNYIIPAVHDWLVNKDIIQIRDSYNLEKYFTLDLNGKDIILNLDLDFFQPELDFIDYNLKKKAVLDAAEKASIITVASSPFFIDQDLAIKVFKDIFWSPHPNPLPKGEGI